MNVPAWVMTRVPFILSSFSSVPLFCAASMLSFRRSRGRGGARGRDGSAAPTSQRRPPPSGRPRHRPPHVPRHFLPRLSPQNRYLVFTSPEGGVGGPSSAPKVVGPFSAPQERSSWRFDGPSVMGGARALVLMTPGDGARAPLLRQQGPWGGGEGLLTSRSYSCFCHYWG